MKLLKFVFNYKKITAVNKDTDEEFTSYYPVIPCVFESTNKKTPHLEGLMDSGAEGIIIPMALAELLELDLRPADNPMMVVGDKGIERYLSEVNMTIGRGGRRVYFQNVEVSIPKKGDTPILIGRDPVFKHYEITFIEAERKLILKPYKK